MLIGAMPVYAISTGIPTYAPGSATSELKHLPISQRFSSLTVRVLSTIRDPPLGPETDEVGLPAVGQLKYTWVDLNIPNGLEFCMVL
jgi:hypothetical protein